MARTTIIQVAKIAGVSPTAVSLAINGKPGISDHTRAHILEIVKQMNFTPNESSRRLLSNRTNNIAVLMDSELSLLDQSFYSELNTQIIREVEERMYNVVYCVSRIGQDQEIIVPKVIRSRDVDGIIILGYLNPGIIKRVASFDCPMVILDNYFTALDINQVIFNYKEAVSLAAEYLISQGHQKIGFIGSDISSGKMQYFGQQAFLGFRESLEKHKLSVPASWIQMGALDEDTASEAMLRILADKDWPTAVLCSGDIFAIGACRSLKKSGCRIPDDISLIGVDDIILSRYVEPPLTTVHMDRKALAVLGVETLIKSIQDGLVNEQVICNCYQLVERESVARRG
jgi:DNA-binding LacI/PurR family transcriptional regulator